MVLFLLAIKHFCEQLIEIYKYSIYFKQTPLNRSEWCAVFNM